MNRHRGFGNVTFADANAAAKAVSQARSGQVKMLGRVLKFEALIEKEAQNYQQLGTMSSGQLFTQLKQARRRDEVERCLRALGPLQSPKA